MFDPTDDQLLYEIEEAETMRNDHLHGVNRIIKEYTGNWYRGRKDIGVFTEGAADGEQNPDPFSYSFVSNVLPSLLHSNPSVLVEARRVVGHKMVEEAMESGLKGWILDIDLKKKTERVVLDFLFFQGILMHYIEDDERWSNGAVRPNIDRVDPRHFGGDSLAPSVEEAEFLFHDYNVDIEELQGDPDIIPESLEKIRPTSNADNDDLMKEPFKKGDVATLSHRKRVKIYSVWLRKKNVIRVICKEPRALKLYEERPYYGPPERGPYTVFAAYPVPNQFFPLSPLIAVHDQVRDLQTHARAAQRSAATRKTLVIVDSTVGTLPEDIKEAEDREVIGVPGFNSSQAQQIEFGGMSREQYQYLAFLQDRLDRHSGLNEMARGGASGADTATEAQIANEALNNRLEFLKQKVRNGMEDCLRSIGWFLFHTPGVIIPVSRRDPATGIETEGLFFGGPQENSDVGDWYDYQLRIEPLSMQRVSEALLQRRALDFAGYIQQIAPLIPQMPWIKWVEVLKMVGESMNIDNVDDFLVAEMLGPLVQPELFQPSLAMGGQQMPPQRFSMPGAGFKTREQRVVEDNNDNSNAPMAVDQRRADFGQVLSGGFGGRQGPPGSRAG